MSSNVNLNKHAIVTGAGSGVGQAVALQLLAEGWNVSLIGRRAEALEQTRSLAIDPSRAMAIPCDVADEIAVADAFAVIVKKHDRIDALINSAGLNIPVRSLESLSIADFKLLIDVNLNGAFYWVHAVLPIMKKQGNGTIVNVISDAGLIANAKAGPAYVASKFGLTGLTQSINFEQRGNGIRACAICPGDINTPLLDKRPVPPPKEARLTMLQPADVAACVMLAINLPENVVVEQLVVRPR